jgi:outer membrane protein OmpA-like peptidoglycan-associated protein
MRKVLILYLLLFPMLLNGYAQEASGIEKFWQIKGLAKSSLRYGDYFQARDYLLQWHQRDSNNLKVRYWLGDAYFKTREYDKALNIYASIYNNQPRESYDALYEYAKLQKIFGRYEIALEAFQNVRRNYRKLKHSESRARIDNEIAGCRLGLAWRDTVVLAEVSRMNDRINGPNIEFGPILLSDHRFVYGTYPQEGEVQIPLGANRTTQRQYQEATYQENTWTGGIEPGAPFFNENGFDTGTGVFSMDQERYYSTRCVTLLNGKMHCNLYVSHKTESGWSAPEKLDLMVNHRRYSSSQPAVGTCFNRHLEVIYFVSDRPKGAGGKDIWFTVYNQQTGKYKKAENAGVFINTSKDEVSPFYDLPSHCLLFSSNGWPSLGGLDVFQSRGDMVTWDMPENMKLPINSSYDDLHFVRNTSGKFGLLASNRPGSASKNHINCCDDLYQFNQLESPRILVKGRLLKEDVGTDDNFFKKLSGKPIDNLMTGALKNKTLTIQLMRDSTSSVVLQQTQTNELGEFEIWVDPNSDFKIVVNDTSLLDRSIEFSTKTLMPDKTLNIETRSLSSMPLSPVVINDILYEFNSFDLSSNVKAVLDSTLLELLNKYPQMKLEIGSHTDHVGDDKYNMRLSQKRAASVVNYLIEKGISSDRLVAKGYGETMPVAENTHPDGSDSAEGRQRNRRTEFKIISNNDNEL